VGCKRQEARAVGSELTSIEIAGVF